MKRNSWFLGFLSLALLATVARGESPRSPEAITEGITQNMHANYDACNQENLTKLLACMSKEMPNRDLFVQTVKNEWAAGDTYNKLEAVEVLKHSDAPHANCEFPYATAWITQTVVQMRADEGKDLSVFRQQCKNGRCPDAEDLAHKMGLATTTETTKLQMLFKYEGGKWKLIAGLTNPVPAGKDSKAEREESVQPADVQVGAPRARSQRSVFN